MKSILAANVIKNIVYSDEIKEKARYSSVYFTRNRKISFPDLLWFLLNPAKECTQIQINNFFKRINVNEEIRMSQQAISKGRSHFDHSPFEAMTRALVEEEYSGRQETKTWNGYHIFAVDGSSAILPNVKTLLKDFGASGCTKDCPTAGISMLVDVLSGWIVDASILQYPLNEREAAKNHVAYLKSLGGIPQCILLFDRGYPSYDLIRFLLDNEMNYVMRVQKSWAGPVEGAPMGDSFVTWNELQMRVYKFLLPSGELETLVTNRFELSCHELENLYFLRWHIETGYDLFKNKIQAENFTGVTKNSIMQDFWVSVTLSNLVMVFSAEANEIIQKKCEGKNNKNKQIPNLSQLTASLKDDFVKACIHKDELALDLALARIALEVSRTSSPVRPGRSFPRSPHPKKRMFPFNRKSNI